VEVRMHFLDRFMKDICILPYLYQSAELQVFLRPNGDLEKAFKSMPIQSTDDLIIRFRNCMPVNEVTNIEIHRYNHGVVGGRNYAQKL
jgi:hypothetical protein